jgi:hypothetical protein
MRRAPRLFRLDRIDHLNFQLSLQLATCRSPSTVAIRASQVDVALDATQDGIVDNVLVPQRQDHLTFDLEGLSSELFEFKGKEPARFARAFRFIVHHSSFLP